MTGGAKQYELEPSHALVASYFTMGVGGWGLGIWGWVSGIGLEKLGVSYALVVFQSFPPPPDPQPPKKTTPFDFNSQ